MIRRLGVVFLGCLLALGAGCDGGGETDAGVDAGPPREPVQIVTGVDGEGDPIFGPADFTCTGMAPTETGTPVAFNAQATSFGTSSTVADLVLQFFADNAVPLDGTCGAGCTEVTTDASGIASVMDVPSSWYAYRVPAGSGTVGGVATEFVEVVQYNEIAPAAGGMGGINAVAATMQNSFILLLGATRVAGTAVVTGQAFDCMGEPVVNATIRMYDSAGEIPLMRLGPDYDEVSPFQFYFNGEQFPAPRQPDTNVDGLYGAANLAVPTDNVIRVETYGALEAGGAETMLGCEEVQVNADGITIINIGPARSDGPSGCSG
jgi:hypothetical protein